MKKQKLIFDIEKELLDRIDDYRFDNRVKSRAEAIRLLLEKALPTKKNVAKQKK